jgi:hypothetical protein
VHATRRFKSVVEIESIGIRAAALGEEEALEFRFGNTFFADGQNEVIILLELVSPRPLFLLRGGD